MAELAIGVLIVMVAVVTWQVAVGRKDSTPTNRSSGGGGGKDSDRRA